MAEARRRVNLASLGLANIRLKQAMNGGTLIEVPRPRRVREEDSEPPTSAELADRLAEELRGVFQGREIRVTRPTKSAEMRLTGLDNSVTSGDVRGRSPSGTGTIWMRAPAVYVRRVVIAGKCAWGGHV